MIIYCYILFVIIIDIYHYRILLLYRVIIVVIENNIIIVYTYILIYCEILWYSKKISLFIIKYESHILLLSFIIYYYQI